MNLQLYYHPLSSFCWKALIALYENGAPFEPLLVDLGDEHSRESFLAIWPVGRFPVLRDGDRIIPESTIIIEYLDTHHPSSTQLIPRDREAALDARAKDRFFDLYLHAQMQRIVGERLRSADAKDPTGLAQAHALMRTALGMVEHDLRHHHWALGEMFTIADCAAAPALHYADKITPLKHEFPHCTAYLDRLRERPSFARVLREAAPYAHLFPQD